MVVIDLPHLRVSSTCHGRPVPNDTALKPTRHLWKCTSCVVTVTLRRLCPQHIRRSRVPDFVPPVTPSNLRGSHLCRGSPWPRSRHGTLAATARGDVAGGKGPCP